MTRFCFVHAVGPRAGQGASKVIEDAFVLAAALECDADHEAALGRYKNLQRPRVAEVIRLTAQVSSQKHASGRWQILIRDLLLRVLIPLGIKGQRKLFAYRADEAPLGAR